MQEKESIKLVIGAIKKVPAKNLLLIDLANDLVINGKFDRDKASDLAPTINLAVAEAKMYGASTMIAAEALKEIEALVQNV